MFVHSLDVAWIDHPFLRSQFMLRRDSDVEKIVEAGIHHVWIDTSLGQDAPHAPTEDEVMKAVDEEIRAAITVDTPAPKVSVAEEMERARKVRKQAHQVISKVMRDARLGHAIEMEDIEQLVEDITLSITRNSGALAALLQIKTADEYTFLHSVAVCTLMVTFARFKGLGPEVIRHAGIGGLLHDTGKMKVPPEILNKPGRLTDAEFAIVKRHPSDGWEMLREAQGVDEIALDITLHHHERMDGTGYPHKLAGEQISTLARMASIVDVYDAITSNRCYHSGLPATEALRKMWEWSKFQFDQSLMQAFIRTVGIYPVGSVVKLESGRIGVVTDHNEGKALQPKVRVFFSTRSNLFIPPEEVDLSRSLGHGGGDRIVGHEDAAKWNIDPLTYLAQ